MRSNISHSKQALRKTMGEISPNAASYAQRRYEKDRSTVGFFGIGLVNARCNISYSKQAICKPLAKFSVTLAKVRPSI